MTDTAATTDTGTPATAVAGTWDADPVHSSLEFSARYLMATKVRGRFQEWSATLVTGSSPAESHVEVTIQSASISTSHGDRDKHLQSADFFEVEKYPTLEFRSTSIGELNADKHFTVTGDLTAHGVTNPVTLDVEFAGVMPDLYGNTRATFSATGEIEREKWNLTWNAPLANGGYLVSKTIKLEAEVQFVLRKDGQ